MVIEIAAFLWRSRRTSTRQSGGVMSVASMTENSSASTRRTTRPPYSMTSVAIQSPGDGDGALRHAAAPRRRAPRRRARVAKYENRSSSKGTRRPVCTSNSTATNQSSRGSLRHRPPNAYAALYRQRTRAAERRAAGSGTPPRAPPCAERNACRPGRPLVPALDVRRERCRGVLAESKRSAAAVYRLPRVELATAAALRDFLGDSHTFACAAQAARGSSLSRCAR